jgi:hypothetical protein
VCYETHVEQLKIYNEFGSVTEKTLEETFSKHRKIINRLLKIYTGGLVVLCAAGRKRVVKWVCNTEARGIRTAGKKRYPLSHHAL